MKVYLINGESYLLINERIGEILKDSKNVSNFDFNLNSIDDVILEAGYFSIFDEEKYIIAKNANFFGSGKINESETAKLLNYLENPSDKTTIIFVCNEKIDSRKKITKLIKDKYSLISVPNLKNYEIENRVREYFKKLKYDISPDTIKYIVSNSQNNYDVVMMEVEKIVLYYNEPCYIKHEDVLNIVAKSLNTNNFLFVDALVDNDLEKSLSLLNDLKLLKVEPSVLISLIARDFRIMLNVKMMIEKGKREYEIMNELGLMDWQLEKYIKKVFPYKIKELEGLLLKLSELDLKIKSGKIDRMTGLELFI